MENAPCLSNKSMVLKKCKHGYMLFNKNDNFISKSLDKYGEWCEGELNLIGQILKPGMLVLDIGANIGTHSVFFAQKVLPGGGVLAIEPQRFVFQNLCANLSLNCITNVDCRRIAIGDNIGRIKVPVLDWNAEQNFGAVSLENQLSGEPIKLITIDSLKLSKCDFIKIDVEGMESAVLKGAKETISKFKPIIYMENNREDKSKEIIEELFNIDYNLYWHFCPYYNKDNFFENKENVFENINPEVNILCLPKNIKLNTDMPEVLGPDDTFIAAFERMKK